METMHAIHVLCTQDSYEIPFVRGTANVSSSMNNAIPACFCSKSRQNLFGLILTGNVA
jgi:hypothetical protein